MSLRTLQVHVLSTCNLECIHCYSMSSPRGRAMLSVDTVCAAIEDAAALGVHQVAFSGGEPLLHPDIGTMAAHARSLGLRVVLTTNGTLVARKTWSEVAPHLDLVAVSIDGPPETHNHLRNSETAFARMQEGLDAIRAQEVPFALIHTLTSASSRHLPWLVAFARDAGAALLQLHPLGRVGAAASLDQLGMCGEAMARARILTLQLQTCSPVPIHLDVFNRERILDQPGLIYADSSSDELPLPNPIVVTATGAVNPVCHEMPRECSLGSLHDHRLRDLHQRWTAHGGRAAFHEFCVQTWRELAPRLEWPYFNWYEALERAAVQRNTSHPRTSLAVLA